VPAMKAVHCSAARSARGVAGPVDILKFAPATATSWPGYAHELLALPVSFAMSGNGRENQRRLGESGTISIHGLPGGDITIRRG
jgi:hypothetical protein